MVSGEDDITPVSHLSFDGLAHKEFLLEPQRHRLDKRPYTSGCKAEVRQQYPFEFDERLIVEGHIIQVVRTNACFVKAVLDRVGREGRIVFLACEPFLLSRCDYMAVGNKCGCTVMIESGDAQNVQRFASVCCTRSDARSFHRQYSFHTTGFNSSATSKHPAAFICASCFQ